MTPPCTSDRSTYSVEEAAQLTGLSKRSVRSLLQQGRLGFVRLGRRILIRRENLERLLRQRYCRPPDRLDVNAPIRPKRQNAEVTGDDPS
jgi:excisionase family DNA binding protein